MANVIKLGKRPKTFKEMKVEITLPDGEVGIVPVTFKYMDKKQFGKWQDSLRPPAGEGVIDEDFSWEAFYERNGEKTADALMEIIDSWGLDEPLSRSTILALEAECGAGVLPAILRVFGDACREGKLGN